MKKLIEKLFHRTEYRTPEEIDRSWEEAKEFGEKSLATLIKKSDPDRSFFQYIFNRVFNTRKKNWAIIIEGKFLHLTGLTKKEADNISYFIEESEVVYKPQQRCLALPIDGKDVENEL